MAAFKIMRAELFKNTDNWLKLINILSNIPDGQDIIVAFQEKNTTDLSVAIKNDIKDINKGFSLKSKLNGDIYYIANSVASGIAGVDDKGKHGGNALDEQKGKPGGGNALENQ